MMTACVSDSKALIGAVSRSLGAGRMSEGNRGISRTWLAVTVLSVPHVLVDIAPVQQLLMCAQVVDLALFHHQDGVGRDEHSEAVRNADDGSRLRDPQQVGVDDCLTLCVQ